MKVIDLTMPIYEGMPFGTIWPYERAVVIETPVTWEKHGMRLDNFTMFCEPGTRLVMPSLGASRKNETKIDELDLKKVVMRDTVVLDCPKGPGEGITPEDIDNAFKKGNVRQGDAVILRTGWGDDERYFKLGEDYVMKSPYYTDAGVLKLVEKVKEKACDLFFYDTANMGMPRAHLVAEWANAKPRKPGWPSKEAQDYVANYTPQKIMDDWSGVLPMGPARVIIVGGVVNLGKITKRRVKTVTLPLKIKGGVASPCNVLAIEE